MRAIIVAAGKGSRLWPITRKMPKTLLPFGETTILGSILHNLASVGVTEVHIVVGFRSDLIEGYLKQSRLGEMLDIGLVHNPEWERGNGLSVLSARSILADGRPTLLSMSDHLVHPQALSALLESDQERNLLLTDRDVDGVRDVDDATKVVLDGTTITGIGKTLTEFNAVDCGIFRINTRFMHALETAIAGGEESISAAARILVEKNDFASVAFPSDNHWIDIDTPDDYDYALEQPARYLADAVPAPRSGG